MGEGAPSFEGAWECLAHKCCPRAQDCWREGGGLTWKKWCHPWKAT